MADKGTINAKYIPQGLNRGNMFYVEALTNAAMANTDTFEVQLPAEVPNDALPVSLEVYSISAGVATKQSAIDITSHNQTTGLTTLTATNTVASGSKIILGFVGG